MFALKKHMFDIFSIRKCVSARFRNFDAHFSLLVFPNSRPRRDCVFLKKWDARLWLIHVLNFFYQINSFKSMILQFHGHGRPGFIYPLNFDIL